MHEQAIVDLILSSLNTEGCLIKCFSLVADEHSLIKRLKLDKSRVISADVIKNSVSRLNNYSSLNTEKIDVSNITQMQAAELIKSKL